MDKVRERIKKISRLIVEEVDPEEILLFGSRAKGRARIGSDIDIAVRTENKLSLRDKRKLKEKVDVESGIYTVDLVFWEELDGEFRDKIRKEGILIYEKKRGFALS